MKKERRGLSPVIATVLLITLVVVIALIVFLWIRGMQGEAITKDFGGEDMNIQLVCDKITFEADYSKTTSTLYITNPGNIPIFGMNVKLIGDGSHETKGIQELAPDAWPDVGLKQGGAFSSSINVVGFNEIVLIPILIGDTENSGRKTYVCDEKQYGKTLELEA